MTDELLGTELTTSEWVARLETRHPAVGGLYAEAIARSALVPYAQDLARAYVAVAGSLSAGGTLFLCGNGGSMSDALHISGELLKSFKLARPVPEPLRQELLRQPFGEELASNLQSGIRAHVLGLNTALWSAVGNDIPVDGIGYAQELHALGRRGDALLGISTSGKAKNVRMAVSVAKAIGITTIGLCGQAPNPLSDAVDIALAVHDTETYRVQELHLALYHQFCLMLEAHFFGGG